MANLTKIFKQIAEKVEQAITITEDIMFPYKGFDPRYLYRDEYSYKRAIKTLETQKLIKRVQDRFFLTLQGKLQLLKSRETNFSFDYKKWDGKWRILAFDIPEKNRKTRNQLREYLVLLGFKPIQQSIWITPLDIKFEDLGELFDKKIKEKLFYSISREVSEKTKLKKLFDMN